MLLPPVLLLLTLRQLPQLFFLILMLELMVLVLDFWEVFMPLPPVPLLLTLLMLPPLLLLFLLLHHLLLLMLVFPLVLLHLLLLHLLLPMLLLPLLLLLFPVRLSSPLSSLTLATPSPTVWIKSSSRPSLHSASQTLP